MNEILDQLKNNLYLHYLQYKYRDGKIWKHIRNKQNFPESISNSLCPDTHSSRLSTVSGKFKVGTTQVKMELSRDPFVFADRMEEFVYSVSKDGGELVVFPEENLTQLIGLLPGIDDVDTTALTDDISIIDILFFLGPLIKRLSLRIFSELARKYRIYIMTGSGLLPGNEGINIYNIAYLFAPDGSLLGEQKKIHLLPIEGDWGIKTGNELKVYETEIAPLAFPICMDATYFETFQIARKKGADIIIIPIANPDPEYNYWTALRGIWGRVQESDVYGIKSAMVGKFLDFQFTGQAGIYAPLELTDKKDGIIAETESYDKEEILLAELDLEKLHEYREGKRKEINQDFQERYFPDIYNDL